MAADHSEARVVDYSRQGLWTVGRCLHASNYAKIPGWQGLPLGCALAIGYPEPAAPGNRQARADRSARSWLEASVVAMTVALRRSTVERSPLDEASAAAADNPPPALPPGIKPYLSAFQNWSGEIVVDSLWTCSVSSPEEVVMLANWARTNAYRLRPRGYSHNWSPLAIPPGTTCGDRVLLVDTTASLTTISVNPGAPASVTAQAGASMQAILSALEECGYGLTHHPAPGDLTIGGVLAIDGHGTAVPADGETLEPGHTFGSVSNLVLSITAVVWDAASDGYVLRTFRRTEPAIGALMAHLGRAFVTEVTLRVGANAMMRCRSHMDIPASEMFGAPSARGRSIEKFLAESGRVEAIWFPFTANVAEGLDEDNDQAALVARGRLAVQLSVLRPTFPAVDLADGSAPGGPTPVGADARKDAVGLRCSRSGRNRWLGSVGLVEEHVPLHPAGHASRHGQRLRDHLSAHRRTTGDP
jgi:FAD/FMN-containing dehydrogenase